MSDNVLDIAKALDTSSGTTGKILVPEVISAGIRMFVETRSPLYNMIERFTHDGYAYTYKEQNGLPTASYGAELGALPAAQNATYAQRTVDIKSIYIRGEVSGQLIEASRTLEPVFEREINSSALGMVRTIEQSLIAGDSSANPNSIDGLEKWITRVVDADTDATAGVTAGPLSLSLLEVLADAAPGSRPTHYIMMTAMRRKLWSLLQSQVRFIDNFQSLDGGLQVPAYNGVPIVEMFDNNTLLATKILAPDMSMVYMPVLKELTYEELAHTRDSIDYFLKFYFTLVVEGAARHHAKLINVSSTIA